MLALHIDRYLLYMLLSCCIAFARLARLVTYTLLLSCKRSLPHSRTDFRASSTTHGREKLVKVLAMHRDSTRAVR